MTKETFVELIGKLKSNSDAIHQAYKLNIDLYEFMDPWEDIIALLLKACFTEDRYYMISWWVYEDGRVAHEEDGTPIPFDTAEDLYDYLVNAKYIIK
jgi:hypothetical protein